MTKKKKHLGGPSPTEGDAAGSIASPNLPHVAHTPGPWTAGERWDCIKAGRYCVVCMGHDYNDGGCIAARYDVPGEERVNDARYEAEATANTRLIAAAPDLLAACRNVVAQFEAIKEHQHKLLTLGQTIESAAANWDKATLGQSVDFEPLMLAIAKAEGK